MIEWSEMHLAIRDATRRFVEAEIKPNLEALEHGDTPPYEVLRKMVRTFGLKDMAEARFASLLARRFPPGRASVENLRARNFGRSLPCPRVVVAALPRPLRFLIHVGVGHDHHPHESGRTSQSATILGDKSRNQGRSRGELRRSNG